MAVPVQELGCLPRKAEATGTATPTVCTYTSLHAASQAGRQQGSFSPILFLMYVPSTISHLYFVVPSVLVEVTTTGLPKSPKQLLRPASPPKQNCFDTKLVRYSSSPRSQPADGGHAAAVTASKQTSLLTTGSSSSCSTVASLPPSQYGFVSGSGQLTRPQPCNHSGKLNGKKYCEEAFHYLPTIPEQQPLCPEH